MPAGGGTVTGESFNERDVARALRAVTRASHGRVRAFVVPPDWTDDQVERLTRSINSVLEAGEAGLRTIEDALRG